MLRRTFSVGDLVTIAPEFRHNIADYDNTPYIGIVTKAHEENEYIIYWTNSPQTNYYKGMWNGDHLIKVEEYELAKKNKKTLHIREL
jgi:coproporphyrinogen III oxidase-like Fe-S oxidoreductase